ncbi:DNA photolyase, FAD-binding/Cryptochrome [Mycena rebaudengoi]|nr:DNA photolyase, FAD-binding/Cryptochrome [Mycena rebaudengoi]
MSHLKRAASPTASPSKRLHTSTFAPKKIATAQAAAAVDSDLPLVKLLQAVKNGSNTSKGESIVYWMRLVTDNRALSLASTHAKKDGIPLVVLFLFSPQDYIAHDRGARRIDFMLRNLVLIKSSLAELNIPLSTLTLPVRREIPEKVLSILSDLGSSNVYANIEYELDELRRDLHICEAARPKGIKAVFVHDKCVVEPGVVLTKTEKSYAVYSPYQKVWLEKLNANIPHYLEDCLKPHPNPESVRTLVRFAGLFDSVVPESIPGFVLDPSDKKNMVKLWPAGETAAHNILQRFLRTKSRSSQLAVVDSRPPEVEELLKHSRVGVYDQERDEVDKDTTSRLSPYLAAGIISARACVRLTMSLGPKGVATKVDGGKATGIGRWVQEIAWRDFYVCVLTGFPRVSMGRPFLEKYANVVWEGPALEDAYGNPQPMSASQLNQAKENIEKWMSGNTGYPIVDAGMRCLNEMGWMHNRVRMICAMFLVKDLMVDWRVGEKYFMEKLIDGDLASNNGGWQWCASTGVDPCPYFRIFNPHTQSLKADPTGDFIRHYVPELAALNGSDLHNPSTSAADNCGYPRPIVKHDESRQRALRRFKNPGVA